MKTFLPVIPAAALIEGGRAETAIPDAVPVVAESPELAAVVARFADDVRRDGGPEIEVASSAAGWAVRVALGDERLDEVAPANGVRADGIPTDERHGVEITAEGVRVWGPTPEGVHRGLTTLRQLFAASRTLPHGRILDGPRFAWRGLSLDVARTFHEVETVERVIDMCALYKLNVLHLHLTDDQGWRLEIPALPALTEVGARGAIGDRPGGFYSVADVARIVAYAAERFVAIVPEIDMPGHAAAIFRSYPELAPAHAATATEHSAEAVAAGTLDPSDPAVWTFVETVLDSVVAQFPRSAYLHIGGDEAFGMDVSAHAAFVERAISLVRERGRLTVGWQESARGALDDRAVVQHWIDFRAEDAEALRGTIPSAFLDLMIASLTAAVDDVPRALAQGAKLIVSASTYLYFDRPHADTSMDAAQRAISARLGMRVYPAATVRSGVEWDVVADTPGIASHEQIAGVEAAVWCESVTGRDDLELLLLPRLPGAAEKGWATAGRTDWADYRERLGAQATIWSARDWTWFRTDAVEWAQTRAHAAR